jgi:hypothetical protein
VSSTIGKKQKIENNKIVCESLFFNNKSLLKNNIIRRTEWKKKLYS